MNDVVTTTLTTEQSVSVNGAGNPVFALITAYISVGGTSGTVNFQWAQNVAAANNTTILKGSWMRYIKVD